MIKDTGKEPAISTGSESTGIPALASGEDSAAKPLPAAPMKNVNANSLKTLAELLSLIQEDCRRYSEALTPYFPDRLPVFMKFKVDGIIFIAAPPGHRLDTDKGHILLDGRPVTGWEDTDNLKAPTEEKDHGKSENQLQT